MTPKEIRTQKLKMTVKELAMLLNISPTSLYKKEANQRKFTAKEIIELSKIAKVKPSQIEL